MNAVAQTQISPITKMSLQQRELIDRILDYPAYVSATELVFAFSIVGQIDIDRLGAAISSVLQTHPILEQGVVRSADRVGFVPAPAQIDIETTSRSAEEFEAQLLNDRYDCEALLSGAPLLRVRVAPAATGAMLGLVVNHLIFDGWSLLVLCRDISMAYASEPIGATTPTTSKGYDTYIAAQRNLPPQTLANAEQYWTTRISNQAVARNDPFPVSQPQAASARMGVPFGPDFAAAIAGFAAHWRCSPFTLLQMLTAQSFSAVSGEKRFLLACNSSGRSEAFRDAIGPFTNTHYTLFNADLSHDPRQLITSAIDDTLASLSWPAELYLPTVLGSCAEVFALKVNFLELPGLSGGVSLGSLSGVPQLASTTVTRRDIDRTRHLVRALDVTWVAQKDGYDLQIFHKAPFGPAEVQTLLDGIETAFAALGHAAARETENQK